MLIDGSVFFDIGVARRNVGLGLIVVVIGNEILHSVIREKFPHLGIKLSGERFVWCQNQRRSAKLGNNMSHRERLPRAGDA